MGQQISLKASDGHTLGAYVGEPSGTAKGGLVVIQEIFGVNSHVRNLVDEFAAAGYLAIAPALFDRVEPGMDLGYDETDFALARETRGKLNDDGILADVDAAAKHVASAGKVGLIGYCFGGYVAWISGCNLDSLAASVACYGGGVAGRAANDKPNCAIQMHFGDKDHAIPMGDVQKIRDAHPDVSTFIYDDAGHGFCCEERDVHNASARARCHARSLEFIGAHM
ncbi:MAG: dienelactone hydrolase family protein [Rhodospirillales bacterium]|nr:dienelactone hydrolase family protein [Rhodospirillales bacterium]